MTMTSASKARLEKEIEAEVIRRFPEIIQLKTHVKHWPDRIFFLPGGKAVFMEFKVPGEEPSPGQRAALMALIDQGCPCYIAVSVIGAINNLHHELANDL